MREEGIPGSYGAGYVFIPDASVQTALSLPAAYQKPPGSALQRATSVE
jgi:hypothetical protein